MAMTIASGAVANEIYKWTDENGNVHYEDRPSGAATEERLHMTYNRTSSSAVHQRVQARVDARTAREEAKTAAEASEKEAAENAAIAAERAQKCDRTQEGRRANLRILLLTGSGTRPSDARSRALQCPHRLKERVHDGCTGLNQPRHPGLPA
jgi:hypothetical protein